MTLVARSTRIALVLAFAAHPGCGKRDNSSATDKTSEDLRKAQAAVSEHSKDMANNQDAIEQTKRDLLREQQELSDHQKLLEQQRQALGSAQGTLGQARAAYAAAVAVRLAKLNASIATLGAKTDAKSSDAVAGLRARRDQLSAKIDAMSKTTDVDWNQYTRDVDVTFGAIESDLQRSLD